MYLDVCIGDSTAINLELFLTPYYYQATMERYEEIVKSKIKHLRSLLLEDMCLLQDRYGVKFTTIMTDNGSKFKESDVFKHPFERLL